MNTTAIATKFVEWEIPHLDSLKNSKVYMLREKLNAGGKLNRDEKNWITASVRNSVYFNDAIALSGYRFDFSDVLKTYLVKQYGQWHEYMATDKTGLRRAIYGRIERIIEM